MSSDSRVLLVGGAGYIGSVLSSHLLENGYSVTCLDRMIYRHHHTVWPFVGCESYRFIRGDMGNPADMERALEDARHVVILAGLVGDPITKKYPLESEAINLQGVRILLDGLAGKHLEHVIFVSTCSNYGLIPESVEATEDYELKPLSLYAKHKVEIEQQLLGLKDKVDYSATVLRFATAFGLSPRMRFDLTVSEFTRELYLGHELLVFDAHTWRPYCHVKDLSEAIRRVLAAKLDTVHFEVFNVGGESNNFTKQMIVDEIMRQVPAGKVKYQEYGSDPRNYRVSFTKIREQLGFSIQYSVRRGVEELLEALREGLFDNVESQSCWFGNYEIFVDGR
jgi:nucleoside-diphosphate-sugar epimerase